jgi:hypothetical protein
LGDDNDLVEANPFFFLLPFKVRKVFARRKRISSGGNVPPEAVKTIRDLIFWQYAKLIAKSAGQAGKFGFIMDRFKKLQSGDIEWSGAIREYIKEQEVVGRCIYCGSTKDLSVDHLIPRARGGPESGDNAVTACKSCNSSRGDKGIYEWFQLSGRNEVPRIVEGKYLKELYAVHERKGALDVDRKGLEKLCKDCRPGNLCEKTALTVYCLESVF